MEHHLKVKNPLCDCEHCGGGFSDEDGARLTLARAMIDQIAETSAPDKVDGEQYFWDAALFGPLFSDAVGACVAASIRVGDDPTASAIRYLSGVMKLMCDAVNEHGGRADPGWKLPGLALGIEKDFLEGTVSPEVEGMLKGVFERKG